MFGVRDAYITEHSFIILKGDQSTAMAIYLNEFLADNFLSCFSLNNGLFLKWHIKFICFLTWQSNTTQ